MGNAQVQLHVFYVPTVDLTSFIYIVVVVLFAHVHSNTWSVKLCSCTFNMTDSKACLLKFVLVASFLFGLILFKSKGKDVDKITKTKNDDRLCQPKTRVAFAKTHKTGSSTIQVNHFHIISWYGAKLRSSILIPLCDTKCYQNILFRFGDSHNLLFALPNSGAGHDKQVLTK